MRYKAFPHYNQLRKNDCAPTCLKIISKYFGKTFEIEYLRNICCLDSNGVSVSNLSQAGELLGFKSVVFDITFDQLIKKAILPCIAYLDDKHFVVIYRISFKYIHVSDPASKKIKYTYRQFEKKISSRWEVKWNNYMF